jgi:4-aminobutyrate aminotransferase/(S)-3-amino-2-methylpropionate transaminase
LRVNFEMSGIQDNMVAVQVPGPLSKASAKKLDAYFDARAVHFVVDYEKSSGM